MPSRKTSWPTIPRAGDTGRFTWEQIDDTVKRAVVRREAREAKAAHAVRETADVLSGLSD
jgi:hypothetical protein